MNGPPLLLHVREDPNTHCGQIANCPYDWIPIKRPSVDDPRPIQINQKMIVNMAIELDAIPCIGDLCAIYPCERVRDFSEGKI
jgi:hypothetical protein